MAQKCSKVAPISPKLVPRASPSDRLELQGEPRPRKKPSENAENLCFYNVHNIALRRPWDALFTSLGPPNQPPSVPKGAQRPTKGAQRPTNVSIWGPEPAPNQPKIDTGCPKSTSGTPNAPKIHQKVTQGFQISPIVDIFERKLGAIFLHMNFNDPSKSTELPQRKKNIEVRRCRVSVLNKLLPTTRSRYSAAPGV